MQSVCSVQLVCSAQSASDARRLFYQGLAVIVKVAVKLENGLVMGEGVQDDAVPLVAHIEGRETAFAEQSLGLLQSSLSRDGRRTPERI